MIEKSNESPIPTPRSQPPHEAVLLSRVITERKQIEITFLDGEIFIDHLRWHTPQHMGLRGGRVVNKSAVKFWKVLDEKN